MKYCHFLEQRQTLIKTFKLFFGIVFLLLMALSACTPTSAKRKDVILATTTSTQDSGLLDVLIPLFEAQSDYRVKTIAVGTGKALAMGMNGDADVLLVHAPKAEEDFMASGSGKERLLVMHNDFVLLGPISDAVGVQGETDVANALAKIAEDKAVFVSRGDDSGTHKLELSLWQSAGVQPDGDWYIETGQGMAASLRIASEKSAYILSDRATFLANRVNEGLTLEILLECDPRLINIYHVITINPDKFENLNYSGGLAFASFLTGEEAQGVIANFGVDTFGVPLFIADAGQEEAQLRTCN